MDAGRTDGGDVRAGDKGSVELGLAKVHCDLIAITRAVAQDGRDRPPTAVDLMSRGR
jgi:hypothetical protein